MSSISAPVLVPLKLYLHQNPDADRRVLVSVVAAALESLHQSGFVHGMLDIAHVVVDGHNPRLVQSSLTRLIEADPQTPITEWERLRILSADVYALGWFIFQVITGVGPEIIPHDPIVFEMIKPDAEPPLQALRESGLDNRVWEMLLDCWTSPADSRPTLSQIIDVLNSPTPPPPYESTGYVAA